MDDVASVATAEVVVAEHLDMSSEGHGFDDVKTEIEGCPKERLNTLVDIVSEVDTDTLLEVTSPKLLEHFSIWDLMLQKAKISSAIGTGALESILNDVSAVLGELKLLVESCLVPVRMGRVHLEPKFSRQVRVVTLFTTLLQVSMMLFCLQVYNDFVRIDSMLSLALCIESDANIVWKKRDSEDIIYSNPLLDLDLLFPSGTVGPLEDHFAVKKERGTKRGYGDDYYEEDFAGGGKKKSKRRSRKMGLPALLSKSKKEGQFHCGKCGKKYVSATALYSHLEKSCEALKEIRAEFTETGDGRFMCLFEDCNDIFPTKDNLDIHWADEHVPECEKYIPCVSCSRKFATPAAKAAHVKRAHVKPFKCDLCDRCFSVKENLQYHLENHAEIGLSKMEYKDDGDASDTKEKEKIKIKVAKKEKEKEKRHLCLKCGQTVAHSHGKKHEARCTGLHIRHPKYKRVGEEYWCTEPGCSIGYGFTSFYGLRTHFHKTHIREEEKYFACDYCDERFSFQTTKNRHMREKHVKAHICDICGKGFGLRKRLLDHRLIHTGEKPYACNHCDYRASKKGNLDAHKVDRHGDFGGNKNYACAECQKQFTTIGRVRRHMQVMHAEGKEESARMRRQRQKLQLAAPQENEYIQAQHFARHRSEEEVARPTIVRMVPVQSHQGAPGHRIHVQQDEQDAAVKYLETDLVSYQ